MLDDGFALAREDAGHDEDVEVDAIAAQGDSFFDRADGEPPGSFGFEDAGDLDHAVAVGVGFDDTGGLDGGTYGCADGAVVSGDLRAGYLDPTSASGWHVPIVQ
jgi:hypothetical protein